MSRAEDLRQQLKKGQDAVRGRLDQIGANLDQKKKDFKENLYLYVTTGGFAIAMLGLGVLGGSMINGAQKRDELRQMLPTPIVVPQMVNDAAQVKELYGRIRAYEIDQNNELYNETSGGEFVGLGMIPVGMGLAYLGIRRQFRTQQEENARNTT
ncbi:MAG: hypothetical protein Q7S61_00525 [bacterium]|nr:hypothetical protein [bacterium]